MNFNNIIIDVLLCRGEKNFYLVAQMQHSKAEKNLNEKKRLQKSKLTVLINKNGIAIRV